MFLSIFPAVILGLVVLRVLINWNKLRHAPGPVLAGFTDLWRAYHLYKGTLREQLLELHARHGPIVRYGVRCISVSDPEVINIVYGSRAGFVTADSYSVLTGRHNGRDVPSLVSTQDEKKHGALRRAVANVFTPSAVLDYERWIDITIKEFLESIARKSSFDLTSMIMWYIMDASARVSFGAPLGCLAAEADADGSIQMIRDRFIHWTRWSSYPQIERLVHRNPLFTMSKHGPSNIVTAANARLKARAEAMSGEKGREGVGPDLMQRLLEASKDFPQVLDGPGITSMLTSTISGAGDTTASTVVAVVFYLLKNPEVLAKLEAELSHAGVSEIPSHAEVGKLPYLNAVIKETMRIFSVIAFPLERLVPAGGAEIAGMYFPEGTTVGCLPAAVHVNAVFGADVDAFRPERWLVDDREQVRLMEAANMGFSRGRKNCLGQNVALLSMKKVVSALVMKYRLRLVEPEAPLGADFTGMVAVVAPIHVTSEAKR
ncbi:cytochrome P450 [Xylaria sp. CBS 124048]|nr:cytochrome P450 [Xylaria sp. CBS 124048]